MCIYRFIRSEWAIQTEKSLKIPPGHMASLKEVIEKAKNLVVQSERSDAWRKRCKSSNLGLHEKVKRQKQTELKTDSPDLKSIDTKIDSFEIATKLRQQVSKWQKTQSDTYLRELKEHEHFEIKVQSFHEGTFATFSNNKETKNNTKSY